MASYDKAPDSVYRQAVKVLNEHQEFAHLVKVGMTFQVIFAYPALNKDGEPTGPAIKAHGYPATAKVKINSHEKRVEGLPDVTITVDGDWYGNASEKEQEAMFFHEFYHLELSETKDGDPNYDDSGRPKLKIRLHDQQIGIFAAPMKKFGAASGDMQQLAELIEWSKEEEVFVQGVLFDDEIG